MKRQPRKHGPTEYTGPHRDTEVRVRSAVAVIHALLQLGDVLYPGHRKRFLTNCLWQITQAEGRNKYDLRYRSRESLTAPRKLWRHEHVYRRQDMVQALMACPHDIDCIIAKAIGCVVTKAEHDRLDEVDRRFPELDGWRRYESAGIEVLDMSTGSAIAYDE